MKRVLLVGAGEVGALHLEALAGLGSHRQLVGIADPASPAPLPNGVPVMDDWKQALVLLEPDMVIVATPPGIALEIARAAAAQGARVLVEKPATLDPVQLAPQPGDERIFVAFQPHFAPGLTGLLANRPAVARAEVTLECRRDRPYYRGWRAGWATSGGILHQQAIHGLALVLRMLQAAPPVSCTATVRRDRGWADSEDQVTANLEFASGQRLYVDARVDSPDRPYHHVLLCLADGSELRVRGRNLEAGLMPLDTAPSHQTLRQTMYEALLTTRFHRPHPSLFPLSELRRTLDVIDHIYAQAAAEVPQ